MENAKEQISAMNVIFDLGHPAHFHLFKNFMNWLKMNGNSIRIGIQDKDILSDLLEHEALEYKVFSKPRTKRSKIQLLLQWREHKNALHDLAQTFRPDLLVGTSVAINWVGRKYKASSWNFNEDDHEVIRDYWLLASPFVTYKIKPSCLRSESRKRDIYHESYHELAYLHPDNFTTDRNVLSKYDLKEKGYIVVRFSALRAHHDSSAQGISNELSARIEELISDYTIIKSIENKKTHQIAPWDMHHIIAFSKMVISDSQTMTAEAAVLGIPAIRCNTFVGRISYLEELEHRYGLTYGFLPKDEDLMLSKIIELLVSNDLHAEWQRRRERMLAEKIDLTLWMVDFVENFK